MVHILVHGEADVLKPLACVVVPNLYGAVQVVLDGDEEFGRVSSGGGSGEVGLPVGT